MERKGSLIKDYLRPNDRFNRRWNEQKQIRRQDNVRIAHGYIRTNGGLIFMDRGVPRKRK